MLKTDSFSLFRCLLVHVSQVISLIYQIIFVSCKISHIFKYVRMNILYPYESFPECYYILWQCLQFEPSHEIKALFFFRKLILQMHMRSHPVGLDVRFLVGPFVYFHTSCVRTVKALARLRGCADSPEPSLVAYVISTIISWAGSFYLFCPCWDGLQIIYRPD